MANKENQEALKHLANVLKIFEENASVDFIRKNEDLTTLEDFKILQQAIDELEEYKKYIPNLEELNKWCKGDSLIQYGKAIERQGIELREEAIDGK